MSKRKKEIPAIDERENGTLRKKHFQAGKDQNTDTMEIECNTTTERQGTEGIALKPGEDEEPVTIGHNRECKRQRTDLNVSVVEEKGRVNGSQEGEQLSLPLSQISAGRYVPVFPKPKNRLKRSDSLKNALQKTSKESSNVSKTEDGDKSHGMVLESSGFCLATIKHQEQASQQPSEQFASNASHLDSKVSGNKQQEICADDNCIQQGSNDCVSHSAMQVGVDFGDHSIEGLMCYSNPINSGVTEVKNTSSKLGSHQYDMVVLCSTPIPVAHSIAFEPLTQSERKTQNSSTSFSEGEPNNELLHHFNQETIDKVPVTHEEVAFQSKQTKWALVISENADKNVDSCVHTPEKLRNFTCKEETHHVVSEVSEVNKQEQELFVQMNLTGDLKGPTCSQPVDLSVDTDAENHLESYSINSQPNEMDKCQIKSQPNVMDRCQINSQPNVMDKCQINSQPDVMDKCCNVNEKMPESPNSVRNCLLMNFVSQNGSNSNWSDMNVPGPSMVDSIILHRDSGDQDVKPQEQPSQCFSEVKRTESVSEIHPGDQAETDIARSHEHQEITQNSCETIHGCGDNIEGSNSINCHTADEETKLLTKEALSENHDSGAVSTDCVDQKCDFFAQGRPGEQCVGSNDSTFFGTQLANSAIICSEADVPKSPVAFKVCTENSGGSVQEADIERGSQISEETLQNTNINRSQTPDHPVNNEEVIPDIEVNSHQKHFSDNCDGKGTENAEGQIINNMSLATTKEVMCNKLSSLANQGFQIECHTTPTEDSGTVDLNRKEIQQDVSSETKKEDIVAASQLPGEGMDDDADSYYQKENKQIQDGGSMERGGVNGDDKEENENVAEQRVQTSNDHPKEEDVDKSDMFNQTFFSVEEMDLQVSCDLATGDKTTLPVSGQNLTTISVASSQHQVEDSIARHGGLSMTLPTSSVDSAVAASAHENANTETNERINNAGECKDDSLSMAHERPSTMAQDRVNSQHVIAFWTVNQKDESEQNAYHSTNCEILSKSIPAKVHPDDKGYGLQLVKPVTDNKDMMDDSLLIAPQDNANFSSELEDLHLSEADWQSLSFAEEEDATHVVCGLINELSKINRIIMITHRELESMKRHKNRKARPAGRHPHFPKGAANVPYLLKRKDL